jgi:pimeloyl-ACP methyl ester carboxylesterase/uncharacterized membrane protein YqjE
MKPTASKIWLAIAIALVLVIYFLVARRLLTPAVASQIEMIALGGLMLLFLGVLMIGLIGLVKLAFSDDRPRIPKTLVSRMVILFAIFALITAIVLGSQWMAHTPPILDENGNPLAGSIASLEKVRLGGVEQWLIIRGHDVNKPVLLFLSGGPGGSEAGRVLRFNSELEKHFVVVIWEQRGCGKSYPSLNPKSALTVEQYVSDIIELTDMLRERFEEDKIYLVGHSWGTIIGVRAVRERPDLFHAYIGTAQMVNVREPDQIIYQEMMEYARQVGDTQYLASLEEQGEPPYFGNNPIQPYANLLGREYEVFEASASSNESYRREGDAIQLMLKQPEYGWIDRLNNLRGLMDTFNVLYPQLQDFDFRQDVPSLNLPVYFIAGRKDKNAPPSATEAYFNLLDAPHKQLYYFEDSGHSMIWQEPEKYHDILVDVVLPDSYNQ